MKLSLGSSTVACLYMICCSVSHIRPCEAFLPSSSQDHATTGRNLRRHLRARDDSIPRHSPPLFQLAHHAIDEIEKNPEGTQNLSRRNFVSSLLLTAATTSFSLPSNAMDLKPSPDNPSITHKVKFNVRISRADGTFYVRNDPEGIIPSPDNQVFIGSVTLGLFGTHAPNHVKRFLDYVDVKYSPADDTPMPTYARSQFPSLDQSTGLLTGGVIPGLHLTTFGGSSALEYGGRIQSAKLWTDEFGKEKKRIMHSRAGLLTHRDLDVLPNFGVTTRPASVLDTSYTVFGTVLPDEGSNEGSSSEAFLSRCVDLPTYSLDRPAAPIGDQQKNSRAAEEVASSVYSFQKDFFRGAAKTFGDTRLSSVYEGKILRRIEVTSVSFETL